MTQHVMVFAEGALALSETFIAAHCRSLERYRYTLVAVEKTGDSHPDVPRRHLIAPGKPARLERLLFRLGFSRKMDRLIAELKPDLIHAHYMMGGAFILPYAKRAGIPVITTGHGYDVTRRQKMTSGYGALYALARRGLVKSGELVLPVSDYLRGKLLQQGFAAKAVSTHYLGIAIPPVAPANIAGSPPRIVYAGRLVEKKGLDKVLEAFALVQRELPEAELHIAGDGPLRSLVEAALRERVNITYHGALPHAQVMQLMSTARVFTMPSREASDGDSEGFGLVLIEAQAMGVPVVTSIETGTAESLVPGETGLAVDPHSAKNLADAYLSYLADAARAAQAGQAAYEFVRRDFDIRRQTQKLEAIYDRVLARQSGRREA
ncbi:glycosyltransferase [Rhizobium sp. SG2393]|uniref:glycosyltransferase n=1 Tax=Rhizobium sp. SG2393 TaxID=3276279 RepID=UPI00366F7914